MEQFRFLFDGGVFKKDRMHSEKFLLYFIIDGKVIDFAKVCSLKLVLPEKPTALSPYLDECFRQGGELPSGLETALANSNYTTNLPYCMVVCTEFNFGQPPRQYYLGLRFLHSSDESERLTVRPFSFPLSPYLLTIEHAEILSQKDLSYLVSQSEVWHRNISRNGFHHLPIRVQEELVQRRFHTKSYDRKQVRSIHL